MRTSGSWRVLGSKFTPSSVMQYEVLELPEPAPSSLRVRQPKRSTKEGLTRWAPLGQRLAQRTDLGTPSAL